MSTRSRTAPSVDTDTERSYTLEDWEAMGRETLVLLCTDRRITASGSASELAKLLYHTYHPLETGVSIMEDLHLSDPSSSSPNSSDDTDDGDSRRSRQKKVATAASPNNSRESREGEVGEAVHGNDDTNTADQNDS